MTNEDGLLELRNKLDNIDNTLLDLINQRMKIVHEVGALKAKSGGAIYRPEREKSIIDRLEKINNENKGLLNRSAIEALFLEIFAISRNIELPENIAYLGPEGSFTHQAAEGRFGAMSSYIPISSIKGIFREVDTKKVKFGVVPIENSSNGIVTDTINCFIDKINSAMNYSANAIEQSKNASVKLEEITEEFDKIIDELTNSADISKQLNKSEDIVIQSQENLMNSTKKLQELKNELDKLMNSCKDK